MNNKGGTLSIIVVCGQDASTYYGQKTVIENQIENIQYCLPRAEIIISLGHEADKVISKIPSGIKIVENENYAVSSQFRSSIMALRVASRDNALILFGNHFLAGKYLLEELYKKTTKVFTQDKKTPKDNSLGVTRSEYKNLIHMDYGLEEKWAQVIQLQGGELAKYKSLGIDVLKRKFLVHEILNEMADLGERMKCVHLSPQDIVQIKSTKGK